MILYPHSRICQLAFEKNSTEVDHPYGEKEDAKYYQDEGPQASRIYQDFE